MGWTMVTHDVDVEHPSGQQTGASDGQHDPSLHVTSGESHEGGDESQLSLEHDPSLPQHSPVSQSESDVHPPEVGQPSA
jgi:hypothetical protein